MEAGGHKFFLAITKMSMRLRDLGGDAPCLKISKILIHYNGLGGGVGGASDARIIGEYLECLAIARF